MLTSISPKLPMRDKAVMRDFYIMKLGFREFGRADYDGYLMVEKDSIQIHFFEFKNIDPAENYGQVYIRTDKVDEWYNLAISNGLNAKAPQNQHWLQREFSLLDPDNNLLTFGQSL